MMVLGKCESISAIVTDTRSTSSIAGVDLRIGELLAWLEATLILATVSYRWRLLLPPNAPEPVPEPRITLRPRDGLRLVPEPR